MVVATGYKSDKIKESVRKKLLDGETPSTTLRTILAFEPLFDEADYVLSGENRLPNKLKKLYEAAKKYTFELNTDILWAKFQAEVTPLLDQMVSGSGLVGYRFKRLPTTARARLRAKLTVIPIDAVEDFDLTVELADSLSVQE